LGIKISYMISGLQIQNRPARRPGKGSRAPKLKDPISRDITVSYEIWKPGDC